MISKEEITKLIVICLFQNESAKNKQTDINKLQRENEELKAKVQELTAQVEKLNALALKLMKDTARMDEQLKKSIKNNEDYERLLKKYRDAGIRDDSSNSPSPPLSKKQKVEEMNTVNQDK